MHLRDLFHDLAELVSLDKLDAYTLARVNWPRLCVILSGNPIPGTVSQLDGWLKKSGTGERLAKRPFQSLPS
jgi:hypothetical protein